METAASSAMVWNFMRAAPLDSESPLDVVAPLTQIRIFARVFHVHFAVRVKHVGFTAWVQRDSAEKAGANQVCPTCRQYTLLLAIYRYQALEFGDVAIGPQGNQVAPG